MAPVVLAAGLVVVCAAVSCGGRADSVVTRDATAYASPRDVREAYVTALDTADNIDGPAVYHGTGGTHWLIATAKTTDALLVYDAATGALIRRVGSRGTGRGQLRRPNGITVLDDSLLLVVERDNARVHAFRLPSFTPLGTFGERVLRLPYGISWRTDSAPGYIVYVTDNYETADEQVPPLDELGARVKVFRVRVSDGALDAPLVGAFGDTTSAGAIRVAESIAVDATQGRVLIAEELEIDSHIKVYDLHGAFTGRTFGRGLFPQQAEGIALYACADGGGYWLTTDQGDSTNTFHVFDRVSLEHLGAFTGATARRTDGVALTQRAFGPFPSGAFFASHLDGAVAAFSWDAIARALMLRSDCRT